MNRQEHVFPEDDVKDMIDRFAAEEKAEVDAINVLDLESKKDATDYKRAELNILRAANFRESATIPINWSLNESQYNYLREQYPNLRFIPTAPLHQAQHGVLNCSRLADENVNYEMAHRIERKMELAHHVIFDVGGNVRRNQQQGRHAHCCNPVLEQADAVRSQMRVADLTEENTQCTHTAERCDCRPFSVAVANHVLYYLNKEKIFQILRKTASKMLFASVHKMFEAYGTFCDEGYYINDGVRSRMYAANSSLVYDHPSINWLRDGGAHIHGHTLCWQFNSANDMSLTVAFTLKEGTLPLTPFVHIPGVNEADKYVVSHLKRPARVINENMSYINTYNQTVYVPKRAIDELVIWLVGRPRDPETWRQATGQVRAIYKKLGVPSWIAAPSLVPCVGLAFVHPLKEDADTMANVLTNSAAITAYNDALRFRTTRFPFGLVITHSIAIVLALLLTLFSADVVLDALDRFGIYGFRTLPIFLIPLSVVVASFIMVVSDPYFAVWRENTANAAVDAISQVQLPAVSVQAAINAFGLAHQLNVRLGVCSEFIERYESASLFPCDYRIEQFSEVMRMKGFPPRLSLAEIEALPIQPGASLQVKLIPPEPIYDRPLAMVGICSFHTLSVGVFNRSHETHMAAFKNRILKPSNRLLPIYDRHLEYAYLIYFRIHIGMFGPSGAATPYPARNWIESYPLCRQTQLLKEKINAESGEESKDYFRGLFYKRELTAKIKANGFDGTKPRVIQSAHGELHFRFIETVCGVQHYLSHLLHPDSERPWVLISSASPEQVGARFTRIVNKGNVAFRESDADNFDTSHGEIANRSNAETNCHLCPTPDFIHHTMEAGPTKGFAKQNYVVENPEFETHSGDIITYIGNSETTIKKNIFVDALWLRRGRCLFCDRIENNIICTDCRLMLDTVAPIIDRCGPFSQSQDVYCRKPNISRDPETTEYKQARVYDHLSLALASRLKSPETISSILSTTVFASGDDSLVAIDADASVGMDGYEELINAKIGYSLKAKFHRGEDAACHVSFCSAIFLPTSVGHMLLPKLGRWVTRMGFYVDPPSYRRSDLMALLRGDMQGRELWVQAYPFLRELVNRQLALTEGAVGSAKKRASRKYIDWHDISTTFTETEETWYFLRVRYGLTKEHLVLYANMLNSVRTLPAIVNFPEFKQAIEVDNEKDVDDADF